MVEQSDRYPSYVVSVAKVLSAAAQPMTIDALVDYVRGQRPIGKSARSAVYRAIKQLYQAVPVGPGRYGWLSHLMSGNVFRHPLTAEEARRGFLLLDELEHAVFFPQFFQNHRPDTRMLNIELFGGPTIRAEAAIERKTWSLRLGSPFAEWIDEQGGQGRDDIVITVRDAQAGGYVVRLQPRESRDEGTIRDRNLQIALAAEDLVATSRRALKLVPTWELAALLIGRGLFSDPVPPDDLHLVLHKYSVLSLQDGVGYTVRDELAPSVSERGTSMRSSYAGAVEDDWVPPAWDVDDDEGWGEGQDGVAYADQENASDESCPDYEAYLEHQQVAEPGNTPLSHGDYHLLEAELEMLVGLEQEFGYLLPDQQVRMDELADRLFLDPESFRGGESDLPDGDMDEPPFWQN